MKPYVVGPIKYYSFNSFEDSGLYHAIFTRKGGISPHPWKSLNLGASVGDNKDRVLQNRERALTAVNLKFDSIYDVYQVHSTEIVVADQPLPPNVPHVKADAIITNIPGVTLLMRFADCVPILLFDPDKRVVGITHAGWIGTVNKICGKAVLKMMQNFGSNPSNILAAIGPSIGPDHYSVGKEVVDKAFQSFGDVVDQLIFTQNGKSHFNLWKANQWILNEVGVSKIEVAEVCTHCHMDEWYSHRGEQGKTGRFGIVVGLEE